MSQCGNSSPGYVPSVNSSPGYVPSSSPGYVPSVSPCPSAMYNPSASPSPSVSAGYHPSASPSPSVSPGYNPNDSPGYVPGGSPGYIPSASPGYVPSTPAPGTPIVTEANSVGEGAKIAAVEDYQPGSPEYNRQPGSLAACTWMCIPTQQSRTRLVRIWRTHGEEREHGRQRQAEAEAKANGAAALRSEAFPSMEASVAAKPKKKRAQTFSISEFATGGYVGRGGRTRQTMSDSQYLTTSEMMLLRTAPRERTDKETGGLGRGFGDYGGRGGDRLGFGDRGSDFASRGIAVLVVGSIEEIEKTGGNLGTRDRQEPMR
ncbi:hypothetical protein R1sor_009063 [Riccia sorocarpa]|uniref:KH domain-containing protein n=1 Tax=Riccia sorocarpa TaxID=122646 RepID=A0ABD3H7I5_9MARC